jgi:hypothetical protein
MEREHLFALSIPGLLMAVLFAAMAPMILVKCGFMEPPAWTP